MAGLLFCEISSNRNLFSHSKAKINPRVHCTTLYIQTDSVKITATHYPTSKEQESNEYLTHY